MPQITSRRFGLLELDPRALLEFPDGPAGFRRPEPGLCWSKIRLRRRSCFCKAAPCRNCAFSPRRWPRSMARMSWPSRPRICTGWDSMRAASRRMNEEVICLAMLSAPENGPLTANLLAPVVINVRSAARRAGGAHGFALFAPASAPAPGGGMLVIRRRPGESLLIGDDVEIEILDSTALACEAWHSRAERCARAAQGDPSDAAAEPASAARRSPPKAWTGCWALFVRIILAQDAALPPISPMKKSGKGIPEKRKFKERRNQMLSNQHQRGFSASAELSAADREFPEPNHSTGHLGPAHRQFRRRRGGLGDRQRRPVE